MHLSTTNTNHFRTRARLPWTRCSIGCTRSAQRSPGWFSHAKAPLAPRYIWGPLDRRASHSPLEFASPQSTHSPPNLSIPHTFAPTLCRPCSLRFPSPLPASIRDNLTRQELPLLPVHSTIHTYPFHGCLPIESDKPWEGYMFKPSMEFLPFPLCSPAAGPSSFLAR